jgi:hypothetical protein
MAPNRIPGSLVIVTPEKDPESCPFEVWGIWLPAEDADGGRWIGPGLGQDGGRVFFTSREAAEAEADEFEGSFGPVGATIVKLKVERA